jgi:hypothetical protein
LTQKLGKSPVPVFRGLPLTKRNEHGEMVGMSLR